MPPFLIEFPADDSERAQRFWQGLLQTTLDRREPEQGRGWQSEHGGIVFGLHERGSGPGDRFSLPYFPVTDLAAAVARVRELGGEIVHPGERWVICRDSEGTPFGLAGPRQPIPTAAGQSAVARMASVSVSPAFACALAQGSDSAQRSGEANWCERLRQVDTLGQWVESSACGNRAWSREADESQPGATAGVAVAPGTQAATGSRR